MLTAAVAESDTDSALPFMLRLGLSRWACLCAAYSCVTTVTTPAERRSRNGSAALESSDVVMGGRHNV
jgi:hypothetical protein